MYIIEDIDKWFDWRCSKDDITFFSSTKYLREFYIFSDKKDISINSFQVIKSGSSNVALVNEEYYSLYNEELKYDFTNKEKKVFISVNYAFFHYFLDSIGSILLMNKMFPGIKFIIDPSGITNNVTGEKIVNDRADFLKEILDKNNINYVWLKPTSVVKINNFYILGGTSFFPIELNELYNCILSFVEKKDVVPTKKVYLSRKNFVAKNKPNRVDNEEKLALFLRKNGFEIVAPEDFGSFKKQINYFHQVKTIFSVTGSGLVNFVFMQPGNTVIELQTTYNPGDDELSLHSQMYSNIGYVKKHNYLAIPSQVDADKIIENIKNNKALYNFIIKDN